MHDAAVFDRLRLVARDPVANSPMSLPGENAFSPAPRTTTQRTVSSAESASIVAPSASHMPLVRAFSFSGRLSTTVAIGPSRSTRMTAAHRRLRPSPVLRADAGCPRAC
jgi:hypothetical protein